jgi:hypothetical protein
MGDHSVLNNSGLNKTTESTSHNFAYHSVLGFRKYLSFCVESDLPLKYASGDPVRLKLGSKSKIQDEKKVWSKVNFQNNKRE